MDRFAASVLRERSCGPGLADAIAWIECEIVEESNGGDHTIIVASVLEVETRDDVDPLVFFKGKYGTFGSPEAV